MPSFILTFGENPKGRCLRCGTKSILVTTSHWKTHPANDDEDDEFVEPGGEVSGHYCPKCNALTGVFIHPPTKEMP